MRLIFLKSLLLLSPFILLLLVFVALDPMKVFFNYNDPTLPGVQMNDRIYQVKYLDKKPLDYNAFIFGSSRSYAFHTDEWEKYTGSVTPYHMGCNDESIYGITHKLQYLVKEKYRIRDALVLLDERVLLQNHNPSAHIFREAPEVSGEPNLMFYRKFFTAFIQPAFLKAMVKYHEGVRDSSVIGYMNVFHFSFNPETGDKTLAEYDSMLAASPEKFYERQKPLFPERDTSVSHTLHPLIDETTLQLLNQIKSIFADQQTSYKIIIAPSYDQQRLNPADVKMLNEIFGPENVYDFSGKNRFTADMNNYYEHRHFKPAVADSMLKTIYQ